MKKTLPAILRGLICSVALLFMHFSSFASHIVGCDLNYAWVSGNTYKVTVVLYGDCGPASSGAFQTLQISTPQVCVYNAGTLFSTLYLTLDPTIPGNFPCGKEITPVCPADTNSTQCTSTSSTIVGIKRFVYNGTVTLSGPSHFWRFVYTSNNGNSAATLHAACGFGTISTLPSGAGRAAAITNLTGGTLMQLLDTLDNTYHHNTNPILTVIPTPYFCLNATDCYNPGALDPDGDSLRFALTPAGSGTGACGTVGGPVGYVGTAWPGQPVTAATPLTCTAGSFVFDPSTGQICFFPNVLQRSVVVYNIEEYRNDTFMGTSQREMTFLVLTCTNTAPTSTLAGLSGLILDDSTHYHVCGNIGAFCMDYSAAETDTFNHITLTVTGLVPGFTYTVTNNGTNHPTVTVCGNTTLLTPGLYTFFLHMQDDNCPLSGTNTKAYSVNIYPVPTVRDSVVLPADCFHGEVVYIIPGGTGKPWTIDIYHGPLDTFQTFVDSVMFIDTLNPTVGTGLTDTISIFTDVSHECSVFIPIVINPPPPISPTADTVNPSYCGAQDGSITLHNLATGITDTVKWKHNGVWQPPIIATVSGDSIVIPNLLAGNYDSIIVTYGFCHSQYLGPFNLVNPIFPIRGFSIVNPSRCGYCDGAITIYGLNPNQLDTIYYTYTPPGGAPLNTSISYFVGPDSTVKFTSLCDGATYTTLYARTDSVCRTNPDLIIPTLHGPALRDSFRVDSFYGCHGDKIIFTNVNYSAADTNDVTFHWYFGDGYTDTAQDPTHVYTNTATDTTFHVKLYYTNGECLDSFFHTLNLVNYISPSYSFTPSPFVCQETPVNFTNTSISLGTGPSNIATTYLWSFGDGNTSTTISPAHAFANTGTYTVTLIETNFVPCSDTIREVLMVDTISGIKMLATDTSLCSGQDVTFTALYASIGFTGNVWSVTDGYTMDNVNPILHAFDGGGLYTVTVTAKYRACPETTATRKIHVFGYPDIYLGPDTSICPGSNAIVLTDTHNQYTPGAKWAWSTGDSSSQITVTKPGYYSAAVTINGCSAADTIWVQKDCFMDLPNVFSPNGDGVNDYFYPRQLLTRGVTTFSMSIYNRWGQLLYQTNNIDGRGWDGSFNNIPQPESVYVYIIDVTFKDGQIEHHTGNVTLLR